MRSDQFWLAVRQFIKKELPPSPVMFGEVIDNSPLLILLDGEDALDANEGAMPKLDSYTPVIGDRVVVIRKGRSLLCLGDFT